MQSRRPTVDSFRSRARQTLLSGEPAPVAVPETYRPTVTAYAPRKPRVLVIEDDRTLSEVLSYNLVAEGYDVLTASNGHDGLLTARNKTPDVIVLDLMIPVMNGIEVCKTLRRDGSAVSIIMMTAMNSETNRVDGLDAGADDYVTKPFSLKELIARIRAQVRRTESNKAGPRTGEDEIIEIRGLKINLASRVVTLSDIPLELSLREFDLLAHLASNPGRVYTRDQLLRSVWGIEYFGNTRTVDVHVRWLRLKIEKEPSNPTLLSTVRGVGYRINS